MAAPKRVYVFGNGMAEGRADMQDLLGGKGANLAEMASLGLSVPPGFTITTHVCADYYANGGQWPTGLMDEALEALVGIETLTGKRFGDADNPLLLSVRSGAPVSMPGMMDTILNLGLNDATVKGLAHRTGNARFAYDAYRRFIQMYGDVVLKVPHYQFEELLDQFKLELEKDLDVTLSAEDWQELIVRYHTLIEQEAGQPFPQHPADQLVGAVGAVFDSWNNRRAITYRKLHKVPDTMGTAVTVQSMVFGNMGEDCATGVAFTRNPSTGEKMLFGEYLVNAQGEDVVAGLRTPLPLVATAPEQQDMQQAMPHVFAQLLETATRLEAHYRDMQDIEFTVEQGRLWMLQTRSGKRTAQATVRIAVDMADESVLTRHDALLRVEPDMLEQLLHPTLDPDVRRHVIGRGLPASPGAVSGRVVFTSEAALQGSDPVILVRLETSPDDIGGMHAAAGILTARGGMTSHAAVIARGLGKPCICGLAELMVERSARHATIGDIVLQENDFITLNGTTGEVLLGAVPTITPALSRELATLLQWADEVAKPDGVSDGTPSARLTAAQAAIRQRE